MIKMYCVFSKEAIDQMKGSRGKLASMAGHAYLHSWWDSYRNSDHYDYAIAYEDAAKAYKITLVVPSENELQQLHDEYRSICGIAKVVDAAITVFDKPTFCCLGIGPLRDEDKTESLKSLKVLT